MLAEADYGLTEQAHTAESNRFKGDESLLVRFYMHPHHNSTKSAEQGRPIFEEVPYIMIMQPGNKDSIINRKARDLDIQRFSKHWRAFNERESAEYVEGTLLEQWPGLTRGQVEELKYFNIRTVEQLAAMSDSNAQGFMGINLLKDKAKSYLEASKIESAATEIAEREAQVESLLEANKKLQLRIELLEEKAKEE